MYNVYNQYNEHIYYYLLGLDLALAALILENVVQPIFSQTLSRQSLLGHMVMIRQQGIDNGTFVVSPDAVCFARGLLLFSASASTDTGSKFFKCTLLSTLETYDDPENGNDIHYIYYGYYKCYT